MPHKLAGELQISVTDNKAVLPAQLGPQCVTLQGPTSPLEQRLHALEEDQRRLQTQNNILQAQSNRQQAEIRRLQAQLRPPGISEGPQVLIQPAPTAQAQVQMELATINERLDEHSQELAAQRALPTRLSPDRQAAINHQHKTNRRKLFREV